MTNSSSTISIRLDGDTLRLPAGVAVAEVFGAVRIAETGILAASLNNQLVSLNTRVFGNATVRPVTSSDRAGLAVLRRSVAHVFHTAAAREAPGVRLRIGHSHLGGWYYSVQVKNGGPPVDLEVLARSLTDAMSAYAEDDLTISQLRFPVEAAPHRLSDPGGTQLSLLDAWVAPTVPAVELDGFVKIQHGPYARSTTVAQGARVVPYPPGLVLQFPGAVTEADELTSVHHLWSCYREAREWNERVGIASIGDLNRAVLKDDVGDVIRVSEALHEKKIAAIADAISARRGAVRLVSVAGPSSAGKSTFVRRLSVQLRVNGIEPLVLGLDDYYRPRAEYPFDEHGEPDYEALEALNLPLIDDHFDSLLAGRQIHVPKFDFARGLPTDESTWRPLALRDDQVLLVEGIHGLNPRLTAGVDPKACFKIYINALMQVPIDEHNRSPTADVRLLRRIVRDRRYRGTSATETIARWPSVQRGAVRHIFPHDREADAILNSALAYETAVLKSFAWRYLLEVPRGHPARVTAYRLMRYLDLFVPVFPDEVPANSVLREFIGGSGFSY